MTDDDAWFAPKRFGYGSSWPVAWQGWVAYGAYCVAVTALVWFAEARLTGPQQALTIAFGVLVLTALLVIVAAFKTRGGWRWRWGGD